MQSRLLLSAAAVALLVAAPALAQQPSAAQPRQTLSQADANFVKEAAIGSKFEVETGQLAERNAANAQVKQFGARMVQDHGNASKQLNAIVSGKGATLPQELDPKHAQLHDRLARLKGAEFDRAYMDAMVKDHDEDSQKFGQEADNGNDPDIKQFARTTLAVIKDHDRMAHEIANSLVATGSSAR